MRALKKSLKEVVREINQEKSEAHPTQAVQKPVHDADHYRAALTEIRAVLNGSLTVQRPHILVISEIVEEALK